MSKKTREVLHSQESPEWYTPAIYVEAARQVMGGIDLDPASCEEANKVVQAKQIYTMQDDGRLHRWVGRVWLNPPGSEKRGHSAQGEWYSYLKAAYQAGDVTEAIFLIYNTSGTQTDWFQDALGRYPICLANQRIRFIPPKGKYANPDQNKPTHGNGFIYFGRNTEEFTQIFTRFGRVIPAWIEINWESIFRDGKRRF